jgi:hypothetical protein
MRFLFAPLGIASGLLAGFIAQKGFERLWSVVGHDEPPEADQPDVAYPSLIAALAMEGAIFRLVKGLVDHGARSAFARTTGVWPGERKAA